MSMQGPGAEGGRDLGAQRGGSLEEQLYEEAQQEQLAHEADRIHTEEAAERGEVPAKKPWWKFWA
jgi:hypothetical protein